MSELNLRIPTQDAEVDVARRGFLKFTGRAGVGLLVVGGTIVTTGCAKNIGLYTETVIGSLEEVLPLLPNLNDPIKRAIGIAKSFDAAYRDGKFANASTLFANLTTVVSDIATQAGVKNPQVKLALAVGGIALRAIGVLLKQQASDPVVAAAVANSADSATKAIIEKMADPAVIDRVMQLVMP
jgi:hypothetical protein